MEVNNYTPWVEISKILWGHIYSVKILEKGWINAVVKDYEFEISFQDEMADFLY